MLFSGVSMIIDHLKKSHYNFVYVMHFLARSMTSIQEQGSITAGCYIFKPSKSAIKRL